jgi:UV DNA damage repair endonuclease
MDYTQKTKEILDRIEKETGISRNVAAGFASMYLLCGREHDVKERAKQMLDIVDEELDNDIPYGRMLENDERSYR